MQARYNVTRVRIERRSFDQGRRKNDAITHSATLPTSSYGQETAQVVFHL